MITQNVVGLEIAMQDAERVEVLEPFEDLVRKELDDVLLELGRRQLAATLRQRATSTHLAVLAHNVSDRPSR